VGWYFSELKQVMRPSRKLPRSFAASLLWLVLILGGVPLLAARGQTSEQEVSEALTCQCGCGLTVANCNHPQCEFSVPIRQNIAAMIAKGMAGEQIIASFRTRYGEKILSAPTAEGFNLLAWIIPFAAVFAGCFIIVGAIRRWRANAASDSGAAEASNPHDPELQQRRERDLRELP